MALAHRAARQEDQQIDRQVAKHQQGNGRSGDDPCAERRHAHDLRECGFIDVIRHLRRSVGRLVSRVHRFAPTRLPANVRYVGIDQNDWQRRVTTFPQSRLVGYAESARSRKARVLADSAK